MTRRPNAPARRAARGGTLDHRDGATEGGADAPHTKPIGFVKLYASILDSSIWFESHATLGVWIAMLAMADGEGIVAASRPGLAHRANVTRAELHAALKRLESPDPSSWTPEHEGRRITAIIGGWKLLNYEAYRELRTSQQNAAKERKKRERARKKKDRKRKKNDAMDGLLGDERREATTPSGASSKA